MLLTRSSAESAQSALLRASSSLFRHFVNFPPAGEGFREARKRASKRAFSSSRSGTALTQGRLKSEKVTRRPESDQKVTKVTEKCHFLSLSDTFPLPAKGFGKRALRAESALSCRHVMDRPLLRDG